ncbi:MAG: hypothetical protein L0Z73_08960 [Gammaproteobacteria bacterium]|nr:hypothetical protein [Gammaproteobacteria bacterium]
MLRLVSITGIALAMVVGFVALSTQMRDDYYMRSRVSEAVSYLNSVAQRELNCGITDMDQSTMKQSTIDQSTMDQSENELQVPKPAVLSSVSYEKTDANAINIVGVFYDVKGESGKLRIKQGRKFTLNCTCSDNTLQCKRGFTDINKNYIPHVGAAKP